MMRIALPLLACVLLLAAIILIPAPRRGHDFRRDAAAISTASAGGSTHSAFRDIAWGELVPADWDPARQLAELRQGVQFVGDDSPTARDRWRRIRELWAQAPANERLAGVAARLPGYVVPLEKNEDGVTEFLLVPYFGACIHTPPPPANQIVHVTARPALPGLRAMDAVRVSGVLRLEHGDSEHGSSRYAMLAAQVEPYAPGP